jgi:biotin-dependent carboxylase-like uncharacterized protein
VSAHLVIARPGLSSTLQDFGRFGYQRFGISGSGAMDVVAMRIANRLVGNAPGTAAIEMTMTGFSARVAGGDCLLAVTGAEMPVAINGRRAEGWRSFVLRDGDRIEIGAAAAGVYAYVAAAGGFAVASTLGSLSTHSRSGIGGFEGRALRLGDQLPLVGASAGDERSLPADRRPRYDGPIRVVRGPQDDKFTPAGIATFLSSDYSITSRTDRMGAQLEGPAIEHADGFNIVSDGIVNGSIQVPGNGRPLVLLADRQTTGGYPKIATIIGADLPKIAQHRPGETVRFVAVNVAEAVEAARERERALEAALESVRRVVFAASDLSTERLLSVNLITGVCSALD